MKTLTKSILVAAGLAAIVSCGSNGGGGKAAKAPLDGIDQYVTAYFEDWDAHADDRDYDAKEAYDRMKENMEKQLTNAVGQTYATKIVPDAGTLEAPFTITDASGNVGKSTAVPYAALAAKIQTEKSVLGYICRDKDGLPVYAGKANVSNGEMRFSLVFSQDGSSQYCIALSKAIASIAGIDILDEKAFENHVLFCEGPSYNKKGFGPVVLRGTIDDIPDTLPGIFDKKEFTSYVEEGPEEDFEITRIVLSNAGKEVVVIGYESENNQIYSIDIKTPEVFVLPKLHTYDGNPTLHCQSEAILLMNSSGGRGKFDTNEDYQEIPVIKIGSAQFRGMEVKEMKPYGNTAFGIKDLVDGTRADAVLVRSF